MVTLSNKEIYEMLRNFKGYGNPKGKYWFIGHEENWKVKDKGELNLFRRYNLSQNDLSTYTHQGTFPSIYNGEIEFRKSVKNPKTFYNGIKLMIEKIMGDNLEDDELKEAFSNEVFITNVCFLPENKDSAFIEKAFKFNVCNFEEDSVKYRKMIADLWHNCSNTNRKTFCLGITKSQNILGYYYKQYYDLFDGLNGSNYSQDWNTGKINYKDEEIYFLYHPSARSNLFLNRINQIIK